MSRKVTAKGASPVASQKLQIPIDERVHAAATKLFDRYGIRAVSLAMIAEEAQTNTPYVLEHFGSKEHFVLKYVTSLLEVEETFWSETAIDFPEDPKGQLLAWLRAAQEGATCRFDGICHLSITVAELWDAVPYINQKARAMIREHKLSERAVIARVCREAGYREPEMLAGELLMLTEGARVLYEWIGTDGPGVDLLATAKSVLAAHSVAATA